MMEKLKEKLGSRKLWAAVLAGLSALIMALCGEELTPESVAALRCAVTAAIAYVFGEGAVDVARLIAEAMGACKVEEKEEVPEDEADGG